MTTPVGLGEHGDCEREDDQEAIGRWYGLCLLVSYRPLAQGIYAH